MSGGKCCFHIALVLLVYYYHISSGCSRIMGTIEAITRKLSGFECS